MRHQDIKPGMTLRLKFARQLVYQRSSPLVRVDAVTDRTGYSVPWIRSGVSAFKPSDFAATAAEQENQQ